MNPKLLCVAFAISAALAPSQTSGPARPEFDVASIKPAQPGERGVGYRFEPGGRTVVSYFSLSDLILVGWHVLPFQVAGGSAWVYSERYDIEAKATGNPDGSESRLMIQSLLAERFHFALHHEARELPIYALVPARKNGRPGAGLMSAKEGECTPNSQDFPPPLEAGKPAYCGVTQQLRKQDNGAPLMQLRGHGIALSRLARNLASVVNREVADDTGMDGNYDVAMEYAPYNENDSPTAKSDTGGPSLFTALQEQLGLKLESRTGTVDVLVIDRADRPSEN